MAEGDSDAEEVDRDAILARRAQFIAKSLAEGPVEIPEQGTPAPCLRVQTSGMRMAVMATLIVAPAVIAVAVKTCHDDQDRSE